jgi:hypothetical protein
MLFLERLLVKRNAKLDHVFTKRWLNKQIFNDLFSDQQPENVFGVGRTRQRGWLDCKHQFFGEHSN